MSNSSSRSSRRSDLKTALVVALKAAEAGVDGIPIPGVKGCISGILQIIEQEELRDSNVETFRGLVDKITQFQEVTVGRLSGEADIPDELRNDVQILAQKLNDITVQYNERIGERSKMRRMRNFFSAKDDAKALNDLGESLKTAIEVFHTASIMSLRIAEQKREAVRRRDEGRHEANRLLDALKKAIEPKSYFNAHRERPIAVCEPGTRVSLLEDVAKWAEDSNSGHLPILWLNGRAGVGKSTIAKTLATRFDEAKALGGSFMFSKPNGVTDGSKVCATLAHQLAGHLPEFRDRLVVAIRDNESSIQAEIPHQFKNLLAAPLSQLQSPPVTVIILDALDECSSETLKPMLISIAEAVIQSPFIRIIITSRPEHSIRQVLQRFKEHIREEDLDAISVSDDIARYLRVRLNDAYSEIMGNDDTWPADTDLASLASMASNLFIFAATAVRFIGDERAAEPQRRLELILRGQVAGQNQALHGIDPMYREILQNALGGGDNNLHDRFQAIVGAIVFSLYPHSVDSLVEILAPKYSASDIRNSLKFLHSVLVIPEDNQKGRVQVYHKTFADFISDPDRCTLTEAFLQPLAHHTRLCLRHLEMAELNLDILSAIAATTADYGNVEPIITSILNWAYHFRVLGDLAKRGNAEVEETIFAASQKAHSLVKLAETCYKVISGREGRTFESALTLLELGIVESELKAGLHHNSQEAAPTT